jgi:hypothetical protein
MRMGGLLERPKWMTAELHMVNASKVRAIGAGVLVCARNAGVLV